MENITLPKIKDPRKFALSQTFVRPIVDDIKWRVQQVMPKQVAFNLLSSNPLGQAYLDYKWNYEFAKNPNMSGFNQWYEQNTRTAYKPGNYDYANQYFNQASGQDTGNNNPGASDGSTTEVVRVVSQSMNQGFSQVVSELRGIKQVMSMVGKLTASSQETTLKQTSKLSEMVEAVKAFILGDKFNNQEAAFESSKGFDITDEAGNTFQNPGESLLSKAGKSLTDNFGTILSGLGASLLLMNKSIRGFIGKMFTGFGSKDMIKQTTGRLSDMLEESKGVVRRAAPMAKGFLRKAGWGGAGLFAGYDIFRGAQDSDEDTLTGKIGDGLKQAGSNFIKSITDLVKLAAQGLKQTATVLLDLFGADKIANSLRSWDLGKSWDKFMNVIIDAVTNRTDIVQTIGSSIFKMIENVMKAAAGSLFEKMGLKNPFLNDKDTEEKNIEQDFKFTSGSPTTEDKPVGFFDSLKSGAENIWNRGREMIMGAPGSARSASRGARNYVAEISGSINDTWEDLKDIPQQYYDSIKAAESSGKVNAKNDRSSASGLYQFTKDTWEGLGYDWKDRFNPGMQEEAVRKLTAGNAKMLQSAGIPINGGTLYAAHFFGPGTAKRVLSHTNDSTPISSLVSNAVMRANPFLQDHTVGSFKQWAFQKGGGSFTAQAVLTSRPTDSKPTTADMQALAASPKPAPSSRSTNSQMIDFQRQLGRITEQSQSIAQLYNNTAPANIKPPTNNTIVGGSNTTVNNVIPPSAMPKPSAQARRLDLGLNGPRP